VVLVEGLPMVTGASFFGQSAPTVTVRILPAPEVEVLEIAVE
jgi:hypothetical protein